MLNKTQLKQIALYGVGVLGSKAVYFILVPLYSFYLSPEQLGFYDLILATITILIPISTLQISDACYRFLLDAKDNEKKDIICNAFILILLSQTLITIIFIAMSIGYDLKEYVYFLVFQASFSFYIFFQQIIRGLKKTKSYAAMGSMNLFLAPILSLIFLEIFQNKIDAVVVALILSQVTALGLSLIPNAKHIFSRDTRFNLYELKQLIKYSLPLVPNSLSWWLIDLGSRFLILYFLGQELNGIYAVAARYAGLVAIFNSVLILKWQDFAILNKDPKPHFFFSKVLTTFFFIELILILYLIPFSTWIIEISTPTAFHSSSKYLPIMLFSALFSALTALQGAIFLRIKQTKFIFISTLIGAIVNITFTLLFISSLGLYAVSIGSVLGFFSTFLIRSRKGKIKLTSIYVPVGIIAYLLILIINLNNTIITTIISVFLTTLYATIVFLKHFKNDIKQKR